MRTHLPCRAPCWGLWLSLIATGCGARATTAREAALWRAADPPPRTATAGAPTDDEAALAGAPALERDALVDAVLRRNPELDAARATLRAALAEVTAAGALADPTISYELAPLSVAGDMRLGQRVTLRQALRFPGKRRLAAEAALADAEVEAAELDGVRLRLTEVATELHGDYFVVARALEINEHHHALLDDLVRAVEARYASGHAAQQDAMAAEVERTELEAERLSLEAERDQLVARINGLLHRAPDAALAPAPAELAATPPPPGSGDELAVRALADRPQRIAARARIRAAQAQVAIAERDFYPDVELMSSYDAMWDEPMHRWMIGVMVELPIQRGRRRAAVAAAQAGAARAHAEDAQVADEIRVDVAIARRRIAEAVALAELDERRLVPTARDRLAAARAGFVAGQNDFAAVIEAEKDLREQELRLAVAQAEVSRRRAALVRAVGGGR